jgi:hypothetical protein
MLLFVHDTESIRPVPAHIASGGKERDNSVEKVLNFGWVYAFLLSII